MTRRIDAMLRLRPLVNHGSEVSDDAAERDIDLVARVAAGDPRAIAAFYDRVRPIIERKLRRLLGIHDADFDDMVQNSLIQLIRSVDRFRGDGSLDGWVAIVSARVVFRHIRERRSERRIFAAAPVDAAHDLLDEADVEEGSSSRELLARVRRHLDAIDPVKAWTYVLHDVLGHSLAEVAEITNASLPATQSRLFRGRRELEDRIRGDAELASRLRARAGEGKP
ncbi:MAG: polymerase, sigma-24 subunit, subfamily [Labilithrix sp.]|nr:polymerase, sigma-24 subunit, subfamily [Labilithrix sp.]